MIFQKITNDYNNNSYLNNNSNSNSNNNNNNKILWSQNFQVGVCEGIAKCPMAGWRSLAVFGNLSSDGVMIKILVGGNLKTQLSKQK